MKTTVPLALGIAGLALIGTPQAQIALETIVVDAAGLEPAEADKQGSSITIITREQLEARQTRNAADALRQVPGIAVSRVGGAGSQTQVRVRGGEANQVKVLIDGVEVNSLDAGDFQFETLLTEDIERIEVVRGPQSGVFGSNALAGVINVITRKGGPARVSALVEGGSFNSRQVAASAGGGSEQGYVNVTATKRETDGFNIARGPGEADGSEQQTIFARAGLAPTADFRIDAMGRLQRNDAQIDSFNSVFDGSLFALVDDGIIDDQPGYANRREQKLARVSAELDTFGDSWIHKVFADRFEDDFDGISPGFLFANAATRDHFGYLSTLSFAGANIGHTLVGLVEQRNERFGNATFSDAFPQFNTSAEEAREQTGFAGEYRLTVADTYFLTGNLRHDDNSAFEDQLTYRLSGAVRLNGAATRLHASYGRGVTDPTFFEQFGETFGFSGNRDLVPEESLGWDAGLEHAFIKDRLVLDVTYFDAVLENAIAPVPRSVINLAGETERRGVEVSLVAVPVPDLRLTASYTYLETEDPDGRQLVRRPQHSGSVDATYSFGGGRGTFNVNAVYNGTMADGQFANAFFFDPAPAGLFVDQTRRVTLDDYVVVNAAASWQLDEQLTLFGRVENAFDAQYEEVFSYASAPAAAYAGIKLSLAAQPPLEAPAK